MARAAAGEVGWVSSALAAGQSLKQRLWNSSSLGRSAAELLSLFLILAEAQPLKGQNCWGGSGWGCSKCTQLQNPLTAAERCVT